MDRKIYAFLMVGILLLSVAITLSEFTNDADADTWTQTSDTDFQTGTLDNLDIDGSGDAAKLQLKQKGGSGIWNKQSPSSNPSARQRHATAYQGGGTVMLFGGEDSSGPDDETWVYNAMLDSWTKMNPSTQTITKPSPRNMHSMVFDESTSRTMLFGGADPSQDDETWEYNLLADKWTNKNPVVKPKNRFEHAMAYDSNNSVTYLFGGNDGWPTYISDETWKYDSSLNNWTKIDFTINPSARSNHAMVYDSNEYNFVIFGGSPVSGETWIYNLTENNWTQKNPSVVPTFRSSHGMAFDPVNDISVLFGGYTSDFNNETWTYDQFADTWTRQYPSMPPSQRSGHAMVYDDVNNVVVLYGGNNSAGANNETWLYNPTANTWTQQFPSADPTNLTRHNMVFSNNNGTILFGGYDNVTGLKDATWMYDAGTNIWTQKSPAIKPSPRKDFGMAFDSDNNSAVLFGGWDGSFDDETWIYYPNNDTWLQRFPSIRPSARYNHTMSYDPASKKAVLFGGVDASGNNDETWEYDVSSNIWNKKVFDELPSARQSHAMTYVSGNNTTGVILFGGYDTSRDDETWIFYPNNNTWVQRYPSTKPSPRQEHAMVYDSTYNMTVLFGGNDGTRDDETWVYWPENNTWMKRNTGTKPKARNNHAMVYDPDNELIVLFGGYIGWPDFRSDETWVYNTLTNFWTKRNPTVKPIARSDHYMAYDSLSNKVVLFGGYGNNNQRLDDTWLYDVAANTWTRVNIPTDNPLPRKNHAMAYDAEDKRVVLFGGDDGDYIYDDTWVYYYEDDTWTKMSPSVKPSARTNHAMVYDPIYDKIMLFGGNNSLTNATGANDETWVYNLDTNTWTQRNPTPKPSPRGGHAMTYLSENSKTLLFGGNNGTSSNDETWLYSMSSNNWTKMSPSNKPSARYGHKIADYKASGVGFLVGGYDSNGRNDETWIYFGDWEKLSIAASPSKRNFHSLDYDSVNNIFVLFGGWDGNYDSETWIYNPDNYYTNGRYTSGTFVATKGTKFESISWRANIPYNTSIKFKVAVSSDGTSWNYLGPDGSPSTYYDDSTGGNLYSGYDGHYLRYKVLFETVVGGPTPILYDVSIIYTTSTKAAPSVKVTSPNGGEDWMKGMYYPITWNAEGDFNATPVCLYYTTDNGQTWFTIAEWIANSGHYNWTVPSVNTASALIKVTVTDINSNTVSDTSDASFAIDPPPPHYLQITAPSFGTVWGAGTHEVTWSIGNTIGLADKPVSLKYSTDGGSSWIELASDLAINNNFNWKITKGMNSQSCLVKLVLKTQVGDIEDYTSSAFVIDTEAPSIDDITSKDAFVNEPFTLSAKINDNFNVANAVFYYRMEGETEYQSQLFTLKGNDYLTTITPAVKGQMESYISASDGANSVETGVFYIEVKETIKDDSNPVSSETSESSWDIYLGLFVLIIVVLIISMIIHIYTLKRIKSEKTKEKEIIEQNIQEDVPGDFKKVSVEDEIKVEKYRGYL
jgi:hypothetical protein